MNNLKKFRMPTGISQITLAERAGCARSYISEVELGQVRLTLTMAKRFSEVLRVDPYKLLGSDAIKYKGPFNEALSALVYGHFDDMVEQVNDHSSISDRDWDLYWVMFGLVDSKMSAEDIRAVRSVVDSIAKKYKDPDK